MRMIYHALAITGLLVSITSGTHSEERREDGRQAEYLALRRAIGEKRFDYALLRCGQMIDAHPDYLYLYETLAEVALYARRLPDALTYFKRRIEAGEEMPLACFGAGSVYYQMKDYRAAIAGLTRAIDLGLSAPECYKLLEYSYERLDGVDAAVRLFNSLCHRHPDNANYWYSAALAYWGKHDYKKVMRNINQALTLRPKEPKFLEVKAAMLLLLGQSQEGNKLTSQLITLADRRGDLGGKLFLQSHLVYRSVQACEWTTAIQRSELMIDQAGSLGAFRWLGWALVHLAHAQTSSGECEESLITSRLAADACKIALDEELVFQANIAGFKSCLNLGKFDQALESAFDRLERSSNQRLEREKTRALGEIALTYHEMGQDVHALEYAVEALNNTEGIRPDPDLLFLVHNTLAAIHTGLGHLKVAFAHLRFVQEIAKESSRESWDLVVLEGLQGNACIAAKDYQQARMHLLRRLELAERLGFRSELPSAFADVGRCYFLMGDHLNSADYYIKAYVLADSLSQRHVVKESCLRLANIHRIASQAYEALEWIAKAVREDAITAVAGEKPTFSSDHFYDSHELLRLGVVLLCATGDTRGSFHAAENLFLLRDFRRLGLPTREIIRCIPDSLVQPFISLGFQTVGAYSALAGLAESEQESGYGGRRLTGRSEIKKLEVQHRELLKGTSICYKLNVPSSTPTQTWLADVRNSLLSPDQALLEYVVGPEQTEAFMLTQDTLLHFTVKKSKEELTEIIGRLSYLFEKNNGGVSIANATLANFDSRTSSELYQLLLSPVENQLQGIRRLLIVADEILQRLPFEILTTNGAKGDALDYIGVRFLVESFEISYLPAASSLLFQRGVERTASKTLLALGSLMAPVRTDGGNMEMPIRPMQIFPEVGPRELSGVQRELKEIERVFGDDVTVLPGTGSSKADFLRLAGEYRILHVAGHAKPEPDLPLLTSVYVGTADGEKSDERLHAFEIMNVELNAELAVLSGCNTATFSGRGGVEGLVQAFMVAGVPSVVGSLWSVDDEATADLMHYFYRHLREGERKGRALQLAKIDMIRSGRIDPFYWGAFILVGDNSPLGFDDAGLPVGPALAGGTLLLIALVGLYLHKMARNPEKLSLNAWGGRRVMKR